MAPSLQPIEPSADLAADASDVVQRAGQGAQRLSLNSPFRARELRTTDQIAAIYQWNTREAVRKWLRRNRVPIVCRGRFILADLRDIDAVMKKLAAQRGGRV